jgi:hypothetical protein
VSALSEAPPTRREGHQEAPIVPDQSQRIHRELHVARDLRLLWGLRAALQGQGTRMQRADRPRSPPLQAPAVERSSQRWIRGLEDRDCRRPSPVGAELVSMRTRQSPR